MRRAPLCRVHSIHFTMNVKPFSSPGVEGTHNKSVSETSRPQQQLALPSRIVSKQTSSSSSTATTNAISKTRDSLATIQTLMQPFISTCAFEEGEICRVAVRMEEIASIMQDCVCSGALRSSPVDMPESQNMPMRELTGQISSVSLGDTSLFFKGGNHSQRKQPPVPVVAFANTTTHVSYLQSPQYSPHHTVQSPLQPLIGPHSGMVSWH